MNYLRRRELPPLLRPIHDPPKRLYLRGAEDPELLSRPAVAIVGARACSAYGRQVARMLGRDLAAAGVVVVSGMARGVDGEAHRGALDADGPTVAVLGCGIDRDYPAAHAGLASAIAERSLLVSEYGAGAVALPCTQPDRRRFVRGDDRRRSARAQRRALITAEFALEEGREVFAVPGEITSRLSDGTNALLRMGATPLTGAADVLEALGIERPKPQTAETHPLLEFVPASADELVRATGLAAHDVAAALAELELEGLAAEGEGVYRALTKG